MYLAKSVSCWREVRSMLNLKNDGPLVSIGAGPCLCILGWFWDVRPDRDQSIIAFDVLKWKYVRRLRCHKKLMDEVVGGAVLKYRPNRYFPSSVRPPQTNFRKHLTAIAPNDIPTGSTVLFPFVLNHLVGRASPLTHSATLFTWLNAVRARAQRVIVVDMQSSRASQFWQDIGHGLSVTGTVRDLSAGRISDFVAAYSRRENWPSRRTSGFMTDFSAMVGDATGWRFL